MYSGGKGGERVLANGILCWKKSLKVVKQQGGARGGPDAERSVYHWPWGRRVGGEPFSRQMRRLEKKVNSSAKETRPPGEIRM